MTLFVAQLLALVGLGPKPAPDAEPLGPICLDAGAPAESKVEFSGLTNLAVGDREEDGSVWNEICRSGTHLSPYYRGRVVVIAASTLREIAEGAAELMADGWHGKGRGIPMRADPDHSAGSWFGNSRDDALLAAGEILELRTVPLPNGELSLLGRVLWNAEGRRLISEGRLWTTSIEFWPPGELQWRNGAKAGQRILRHVMTGCVLTNDPMVSDMEPVCLSAGARRGGRRPAPAPPTPSTPSTPASLSAPPASDSTTASESHMQLKALLLAALGLSANTDDDTLVAKVQELSKDSQALDAARKENETLSATVDTLTSDRDQLAKTNEELSAWKTDQLFKLAVSQGRCALAEKELYLENVELLGEEKAHKVFAKGRVKLGKKAPDEAGQPQGEGEGLSADEARVQQLKKQFEDEGLTELDALNRAMDEVLNPNRSASADYQD